MIPGFYGVPGFLHKHSLLPISSLCSLRLSPLQLMAVLSLGLFYKLHVPAPSFCLRQWTHLSGWGMRAICVGLTLSCLPQTECGALHQQPPKLPFCPNWSPSWWGEPLFSFSSPPPGMQVLYFFLCSYFYLFLSFILPWYVGVFLVFLGACYPLHVFQMNCSICICNLDAFGGEIDSTFSYSFAILILCIWIY